MSGKSVIGFRWWIVAAIAICGHLGAGGNNTAELPWGAPMSGAAANAYDAGTDESGANQLSAPEGGFVEETPVQQLAVVVADGGLFVDHLGATGPKLSVDGAIQLSSECAVSLGLDGCAGEVAIVGEVRVHAGNIAAGESVDFGVKLEGDFELSTPEPIRLLGSGGSSAILLVGSPGLDQGLASVDFMNSVPVAVDGTIDISSISGPLQSRDIAGKRAQIVVMRSPNGNTPLVDAVVTFDLRRGSPYWVDTSPE